MKPWIKITRKPYEEPHILDLKLSASNGRISGQLEFYVNTTTLLEWADALEPFPRHSDQVYLWEYGSEKPEDRWRYYIRLRVFKVKSCGDCAILLRLNNNQELPDREQSEFCITAEASQINRLGKLFRGFAELNHEVLYWSRDRDELFVTRQDAEQSLGAAIADSASQE